MMKHWATKQAGKNPKERQGTARLQIKYHDTKLKLVFSLETEE